MSVLYLVRHGQARFLTDDYDRLSDLGAEQSRCLGDYWRKEKMPIDRLWTGTLVRQKATAEHLVSAFAVDPADAKETNAITPLVAEGFNEYPAEAIQQSVAPQLAEKDANFAQRLEALAAETDARQKYRQVHLVLEAVMEAWIDGAYDDPKLPSWPHFSTGVRDALQRAMKEAPKGSTTVVVTSGGPIGIAVQSVLRAPEQEAARLNWRVYNASLTRFTFSGARVSLDQFNAIPHLSNARLRTYR
ncbi:MAG: histidine phosphatase family protein [Myxococcota bacterium]